MRPFATARRHLRSTCSLLTVSALSVSSATFWALDSKAAEAVSVSNRPLELSDVVFAARTRGLDLLLADAATESAQADERSAGAIPNPAVSALYGRSLYYKQAQTDYATANPGSLNAYTVGLTDQAAIVDSLSGKRRLRKDVAHAAVQAGKMNRIDAERTDYWSAIVRLEQTLDVEIVQ